MEEIDRDEMMEILKQRSSHLTEQKNGVCIWEHYDPLLLESGEKLSRWQLAFETYGNLNSDKTNVILIHHALSASSHVASHEKNMTKGWWEKAVGPGRYIDTDKYFIICINNLGSCFGSSGPASMNIDSGKPYRRDFPQITINDMIWSQKLLLDYLKIQKLYAVIGNSMGGMLSLAWAIKFPDQMERFISISSCLRSNPVSIAYHKLQNEIITNSSAWENGYYESNPFHMLNIARKFALLSYRHPNELYFKFKSSNSLINYLDHNAKAFSNVFDANSYLYLFNAMDKFDVTLGFSHPLDPFRRINSNNLIISVSSDLLFPPYQQRELYESLIDANKNAQYVDHESDYGHDAFYVDNSIMNYIKLFLDE